MSKAWRGFSAARLWRAFRIALALVLLALVVRHLRWEDVVALGVRLDLVWLLPTILLYILIQTVMARRYWKLLREQVPFSDVWQMALLQTALTNLVTPLAGSVSSLAMLRTRNNVNLNRGVGIILLARAGDLMVLLPALVLATAAVWTELGSFQTIVVLLNLGLTLLVLLLFGAIFGRRLLIAPLGWLRRRLQDRAIAERVMTPLEELVALDPAYVRNMLRVLVLYSALYLAANLVYALSLAQLLGLLLSPAEILFVYLVILLISYVPITIFGGLGVIEFSAVYLYVLFGVTATEALTFALSAHVFLYAINSLSLLAFLVMTQWGRIHKRSASV